MTARSSAQTCGSNTSGSDYDNGKYIFRFRVDNIGAASADFLLDREIRQVSFDGEVSALQQIGPIKIENLGSDQSTEVRVTLHPEARLRLHGRQRRGDGRRRPGPEQQSGAQQPE